MFYLRAADLICNQTDIITIFFSTNTSIINDRARGEIDISLHILFSFGAKRSLLMYLERLEEGCSIIWNNTSSCFVAPGCLSSAIIIGAVTIKREEIISFHPIYWSKQLFKNRNRKQLIFLPSNFLIPCNPYI